MYAIFNDQTNDAITRPFATYERAVEVWECQSNNDRAYTHVRELTPAEKTLAKQEATTQVIRRK